MKRTHIMIAVFFACILSPNLLFPILKTTADEAPVKTAVWRHFQLCRWKPSIPFHPVLRAGSTTTRRSATAS